MSIPSWWLGISSLFFLVAIAMFAALAYAFFSIVKMLRDLEPRISAMEADIRTLMLKVEHAADHVDILATALKSRLDSVGKSIAGPIGIAKALTGGTQRSEVVRSVLEIAASLVRFYWLNQKRKSARKNAETVSTDSGEAGGHD